MADERKTAVDLLMDRMRKNWDEISNTNETIRILEERLTEARSFIDKKTVEQVELSDAVLLLNGKAPAPSQ